MRIIIEHCNYLFAMTFFKKHNGWIKNELEMAQKLNLFLFLSWLTMCFVFTGIAFPQWETNMLMMLHQHGNLYYQT